MPGAGIWETTCPAGSHETTAPGITSPGISGTPETVSETMEPQHLAAIAAAELTDQQPEVLGEDTKYLAVPSLV